MGILEQADGGTVLLDEIGDTSLEFQVKLLRFLQEGEIRPLGSNRTRTVDVRIISATNRNLEDLFYRLSPMPVHLPPLRERVMDIPEVARTILEKAMQSYGKQVNGFTDETLACLQEYPWPGNVRELENEVRRVLVLATGDQIEAHLLSSKVIQGGVPEAGLHQPLAVTLGSLKERVEELETRVLKETLIRHRWNKSRAALELGLSRVGLRSKLDRYGLESKLNRKSSG